MIANRSLLLVFVCIALILPSLLARRKIKDKKRPRHTFKPSHNVSCEGVRGNKFAVNLEMDEVYHFETSGDMKKKCTTRYQVKSCRQVLVETTFLNLNSEGSEYSVKQRGDDTEPWRGIISDDPHSDKYVNVSAEMFTSDFEIKFTSGKEAAGKMSQVSVEISCISGIKMKPVEERGDCQCGQMKLKMSGAGADDDDRDHNRPRRSLQSGELEIETPWMAHEDDSFSVTIGENYALSFVPAPEEGETPEELPANSIPVPGTQFVVTWNDDADVQFDGNHQPACLPKMDNLRDLVNQKVFAIKKDEETGDMTAVPMKVMDRYRCEDILRKSHGDDSITLEDAEGCLSPHRKSKLCQESIGSPIFAFNSRAKTNLMLIGFVSDISGECAKKKTPAKFARLNNPGLSEVYEVIEELVTVNNSQPLLTCPDHPPLDNCESLDGTPFYCPDGCCGHSCCPKCWNAATQINATCSEGQGCDTAEGLCKHKCHEYMDYTNLNIYPWKYCDQEKVCCENGDGCCSVCNGQLCPHKSQNCVNDACTPDVSDMLICGLQDCSPAFMQPSRKCCDYVGGENLCC